MIRGKLAPEREWLRQYVEPVYVNLAYEEIEYDPFPTPQEAQVLFLLGGKRQTAFVPLTIVNESERTVRAALLGERGDEILVLFPPTNFGQTRFLAGVESLEAIARNSNGEGKP